MATKPKRRRTDPSQYPAPDRSNRPLPGVDEPDDCPQRDLGAEDFRFADGRPARSELWAWQGYTCLTFFCSPRGLPRKDCEALLAYFAPELERAGVPERYRLIEPRDIHKIKDGSGHMMFSITFTIGEPRY